MRLLLITQDFPPDFGGIQTYCYEYAKRLGSRCSDFALVCPDKPDAADVDKEFDFPVYRIPISNNANIVFPLFKKLEPIIRRHQTEVTFHAQWQTTRPATILRDRGLLKAVYCAAHGRELIFNPYAKVPLLGPFYNYVRRYALRHVDHHFPVSHYNSERLGMLGVDQEDRTVHVNGTDPSVFFPQDAEEIKNKLGLQGKKVILTVTRVIYRKGVDFVIRALARLKEQMADVVYVVIGDGPYMDTCKQLAVELGVQDQVLFLGKLPYDTLNKYYNMSDLFIMVPRSNETEFEGYGIVYLEANACKKPVIGSRSGGIASAVLEGETGLLVDEDDVDELADKIETILTDPERAAELGEKGYQRVLDDVNWDALTESLYGHFEHHLKSRSKAE
ncbi:MAG: glycosyltransferase family 4 protein [Balneolaceae bacterium]